MGLAPEDSNLDDEIPVKYLEDKIIIPGLCPYSEEYWLKDLLFKPDTVHQFHSKSFLQKSEVGSPTLLGIGKVGDVFFTFVALPRFRNARLSFLPVEYVKNLFEKRGIDACIDFTPYAFNPDHTGEWKELFGHIFSIPPKDLLPLYLRYQEGTNFGRINISKFNRMLSNEF